MEALDRQHDIAAAVDITHWPVIITANAGGGNDEMLEAQFAELARIYETRPAPYVTVIDASRGEPLTAAQRGRIAEFSKQWEEHSQRYCKGHAFVFSSVIMRGVMTAVLWTIARKPVRQKVFSNLADAIEQKIMEEIESMSEEEAQQMVEPDAAT